MKYNHLSPINVFNCSSNDYSLHHLYDAYEKVFESQSYKPYIEIFLISPKKEVPISVAIHRPSRILDCSKFETIFSPKIDGVNIYLTCFEYATEEYLSWLACKCIKHVEILLNKEKYHFLIEKDELSLKRVKPQKEMGVCDRQWDKDFKDSLSIELITSQFAKDETGLYFNHSWKIQQIGKYYDLKAYNPQLIKTMEAQNLMRILDIQEIRMIENYKRSFFKRYYQAYNYPDDESWLRDKAWRLFKLGYYKTSIDVLNDLIKMNPHNEEYYRLKGTSQFYIADYQTALSSLNTAIFNDPGNHETWYVKANCLYKLKNYDNSISSIDKAIGICNDNFNYYCLKGMCLFNLKDYKGALEFFNKSLKYNPQQAKSWCLKGFCQLYMSDFDNAIKSFDKSLTIKSNYVDAILGKAFILKRKERYSEALEYFDKLQKIKPDDSFIYESKRECILAINKEAKPVK